jgi:hypothetical protein
MIAPRVLVSSYSLRFFSARLYVWGISSSCAQACAVMVLFSVGVPAIVPPMHAPM